MTRSLPPLVALVWAAGCAGDGCGATKPGLDTDTPPAPVEVCNGRDDDDDGAVDEDFPDTDGNGLADCLDAACPAFAPGVGGPVDRDATCGAPLTLVEDPWEVSVLWEVPFPETDGQAVWPVGGPFTAQLDDDNGDGRIDDLDSLDIVVAYWQGTEDGDTDPYLMVAEAWTGTAREVLQVGPSTIISLGLGDLDKKGTTEVVVIGDLTDPGDADVIAMGPSGTLLWEPSVGVPRHNYPPIFADLEGDGSVEILAFNMVLEGATGELRMELELQGASSAIAGAPAVADVDLDGDQEIFLDFRAYDSDGTVLWDHRDVEMSDVWVWPFLVQADGDPEAEVGFVGDSWALYEHDGTPIFELVPVERTGGHLGSPCVGDLDADGQPEVAWVMTGYFQAWELDGTLMWSAPTSTGNEWCCPAACSTFDFDGDGAAEVAVGDGADLYVLDGRTGSVLARHDAYRNNGFISIPVVDVDGDGSAEILFASSDGHYKGSEDYGYDATGILTALTHAGSGWQPTGAAWPVHDYTAGNIGDAGEVPTHPEPFWSTYGTYRGRTVDDRPADRANLRVSIPDVCYADCVEGPVLVALQVTNDGTRDAPAGTPVSLYAMEGDIPTWVGTAFLPAIPAGSSLDGVTLGIDPSQLGPDGFLAVVDDDGTGAPTLWECHEDDNAAAWLEGCSGG